jgi:hypothetical protein
MLEACLNERNLLNKPQSTFGVEKSCILLKNRSETFVAKERAKDLLVLIGSDMGGKCKSHREPQC